MRSLDKRRVDFWTPDVPPSEPNALPEWLSIQLKNLANTILNINMLHVERTYKFPERYKPREGDIILAKEGLEYEGVVIGQEAGMYYFNGEDWKFLG